MVKPRYSAFDHTPLVLILRELEIERLLLLGAALGGGQKRGVQVERFPEGGATRLAAAQHGRHLVQRHELHVLGLRQRTAPGQPVEQEPGLLTGACQAGDRVRPIAG